MEKGGETGDLRQPHRALNGARMSRRLGERSSQQQQQPSRLAGPAVLSSSTLGQFMPSVPASISAFHLVKTATAKPMLEGNPSNGHDITSNTTQLFTKPSTTSSFDVCFPSLSDATSITSDSLLPPPTSKAEWAVKAAQPPPAPVVKVDERVIERDREEQELARLRQLIPKRSPIINDKKLISLPATRPVPSNVSINKVSRVVSKPIKADDTRLMTAVSSKKVVALAPNRGKLRSSLRPIGYSVIESNAGVGPCGPPSPPLLSSSLYIPTPGRDRSATISGASTAASFSSAESDSATSVHDEIDARIQADLDEWDQSDDYENVGVTEYSSPASSFSSPSPFDRSASASPLPLAMTSTNSNHRTDENSHITSNNSGRKGIDNGVDTHTTDNTLVSNEDDWKELNQMLLATTIGEPELDVSNQPESPNGCVSPSLLETSWGSGSGLWSEEAPLSSQTLHWEEPSYSGWTSSNGNKSLALPTMAMRITVV
ncbi:hypothetical protein SeMB42_g01876 [Synchytrium endobioticum]|uniref:Uncharacterized protein n=1 Tax=Synchytrium endobioticum TaxID=286115 RepID=A0A507DJ85_9FUNG|nr:hypothetical protein SeMB42_g01876 [Synchytrium endobioticum]